MAAADLPAYRGVLLRSTGANKRLCRRTILAGARVTRLVETRESAPMVIELTDSETDALNALGRKLASNASWWGATFTDEDRSVLSLDRIGAGRVRVLFRDVVGVIKVGNVQIEIQPKIPIDHFLFLVQKTRLAPTS